MKIKLKLFKLGLTGVRKFLAKCFFSILQTLCTVHTLKCKALLYNPVHKNNIIKLCFPNEPV